MLIDNNNFFDWSKMYKSLSDLDVRGLPDDSKLPKPEVMVIDAIGMIVELRDDNKYRS